MAKQKSSVSSADQTEPGHAEKSWDYVWTIKNTSPEFKQVEWNSGNTRTSRDLTNLNSEYTN